GQQVSLSIRSECVLLDRANGANTPPDGHSFVGTYDESVYLGLTTSHMVRLPDGTEMVSRVIAGSDDTMPEAGAQVRLSWKPSDIRLHVE
ncbi:MAG TPA: TOBE domain-containing protein, partial [Paracoccaceae bacterium]|nr:TOBE domain-containing protein [Paracoccaceae bacterium]